MGAGPPDTIKLIELHETLGSHGISLIKAILKMILQQSSFYSSITMYYNDRVIDLQLMTVGFRQINGKSHHKDASGIVTRCLTKISYQSDSFGGCFPTFHITSSTRRFSVYLFCLLLCHEMFSCFMFRDHCVSYSIFLGYRERDTCLDPQ